MPDRPIPHKEKLCKTYKRPNRWTEQNARDWDILRFCSDTCSGYNPAQHDPALEQAILTLLAERTADDPNQSICPSEAAKLVAGDPRTKSHDTRRDWEALMEPARAAARRLAAQHRIVITQHNLPVNPATAKGPIRLALNKTNPPKPIKNSNL